MSAGSIRAAGRRAADLRFALPVPVRTATVLDADREPLLGELAHGLRLAGVRVDDATRPDVVVAAAGRAAEALRIPAGAHLLIGRDAHRVARDGRSLLVRGSLTRPLAVVPVRPAAGLRHYLTGVAAPPSSRARLRNRALAGLLRTPLPAERLLPAAAVVTVLAEPGTPPVPRIVQAAAELGLPADASWVLGLGTGDDLQRATFRLLHGGRLRWVVKFSRVAGAGDSFVRDERGLGLARAAGGVVAAHAPVHLGRFEVDGLPASLETAAFGRPLLDLLARRPFALLDRIAGWVVDLGSATASPAAELVPERGRLARDVLPHWRRSGAPADLVDGLPPLPAALVHNDLGSWNVISDGRSFAAVDWESARPSGLPLWDLCYFLADTLARIDGPADPGTLLRRTLDLFRGTSPHSPLLFRWIRTAATRLQVSPDAVGPVVTLCWLHHGLSAAARARALGGTAPAAPGHLAMLAEPWLADPALGPTWRAWSTG